ncbi:hypothetical protein [Yinghuangia seranimata]|uniref:hypothetical protein n=1 Tax=Yinghuangia seranimata TaxID=408067 RepID=UPI0031B9CAF4
MQPVLETVPSRDFALWPVAAPGRVGFTPLHAGLTSEEVGAALMRIAFSNDIDPEHDGRPPRPDDPVGAFLHGLLTVDTPFAAGGMRVTDTSTGVEFLPGCCNGLEDWRAWYDVLDGGSASFGHDPDPLAERVGDTVRLTVDCERPDSPVVELPTDALRDLLAGAGRDLADFLALAATWADEHVPDHAASLTTALGRALAL